MGSPAPSSTSAPLPKLLLALPTKVPHQPVGVEGVLGGHAPAHDGIEKGLPLPGVEAQHLGRWGSGGRAENEEMREKGHREGRGGEGLRLEAGPQGEPGPPLPGRWPVYNPPALRPLLHTS